MKGKSALNQHFNPSLYAVTDRSWLHGNRLADPVEQVIRGGATMIQLREKNLSTREFINSALEIKRVCDSFDIPLIINDRLDIALAVNAAGLHVGRDDMPVGTARSLVEPGKILGVSVANVAEAIQAEKDGADYLGAGAVFSTGTKSDADNVNRDELERITRAVRIPVVAIGGINETNILYLKGTGIQGIAVVSAIFAQDDPKRATLHLKRLVEEAIGANTSRETGR
jgi:thiamine-phosphate pyrophosphorylase